MQRTEGGGVGREGENEKQEQGDKQTAEQRETTSLVKYICVEELPDDIDLFQKAEKETVSICHSTYDELHSRVFANCPKLYRCVEPIALFHEVLWSAGWSKNGYDGRHVRDTLHHALERWEYDATLRPYPLTSLCVDIVPLLTSSGQPSGARLVIQ